MGLLFGGDGYKPSFYEEGGKISQIANRYKGMNIMAVFHDLFSDNNVLGQPVVLQSTIIPTMAVTYYSLIAKDAQQYVTPIYWKDGRPITNIKRKTQSTAIMNNMLDRLQEVKNENH